MDFPLPWLVILAVLIGHFGLNVAIYNRINGTAIPRWTLKRITKVLLAWTLLGPLLITFFYYEFILDFFWGKPVQPPLLISCYAYLCFAAWVVFGIPWVIWRPVFKLEWVTAERRVETIDVQSTTGNELALTSKCKIARHLPWNQILELSVE